MTPALDNRRLDALHLCGLSCAAVAQPIFDLLGRNGAFFVSSRSGPLEVLALTLTLVVGVPAVLILVELAVGLISDSVRRAVHLALVAILMIAIALPIGRHLLPPRDALIVVFSAALGLLGALAYARKAAARQVVSWLAALSVLAPLNFLLHSDATKVLFPTGATAVLGTVAASTPVVVVVFDELPLASLLDERLEIDSARYPHFASLAASAYWFRNATSVSDTTTHAVPAILSGVKPDLRLLATAHDHPNNIFSWLGGTYHVESREPITAMCPTAVCSDPTDRPHAEKLAAIASDVAVLMGHTVMPPGLAARTLPRIDQAWQSFGDQDGLSDSDVIAMREQGDSTRDMAITSNPKSLYVVHFLLPHVPWRYLPGGLVYDLNQEVAGLTFEQWSSDSSAVVEGYQRHLLQLGYVDRVLGDLLGRLQSAGIYDDALVVVAADHGCSFRAGDRRRALTPTNWSDVLRVPLLVKLPKQHAGITSDRPVQTIDILPTISTVLHAPLPFPVDGVSMLPEVDGHEVKRTASYGTSQAFAVPNDLSGLKEAATRKTSLFGSGSDTRKLFGRGRFWQVIDQPVARLQPAATSDVRAFISEPERFTKVAPQRGVVPALVSGSVTGSAITSDDAFVAVGVNGIVRAVAQLVRVGQDNTFQTVLPEASFKDGRNALQILILDGTADHPTAMTASLAGNARHLVADRVNERIETTGQSIPVRPGAVAGFVDSVSRTDLSGFWCAYGWAADPAHAGLPVILAFADGKEVASSRPTIERPDIATALADPNAARSGYAVRIPLEALAGVRTVRIFGVSGRGEATELSYPADFPYLKPMRYTLVGSSGGEHFESPERDVVAVTPHAIQGSVDTWSWSRVDDQDYLSVSGWAADASQASSIDVVLVAGDRPVAAVRPIGARPDVARSLKNDRFLESGYAFRIRMERALQEFPLRVFGVSARGIATELTNARRVTHGPPPWHGTD